MQESATRCEACGAAAAVLDAPSADAAAGQMREAGTAVDGETAVAGAAPVAPRTGRREMLIAVAAVVGAAVTFAVLVARNGSSSRLSAAETATVARPASSPRPSSTAVVHAWTTDNRAQWLGGHRGAAFELASDNLVQTWFGATRPTLVVRCMSRSTQAFVYTGSPMKIEPRAEGKTVTVSVDDEPVRTERWPDAEAHDALFAPDGAAFARRLMHARSLRFGYSPHNANDVVAEFHVSGLDALLEPVAKECGWTK